MAILTARLNVCIFPSWVCVEQKFLIEWDHVKKHILWILMLLSLNSFATTGDIDCKGLAKDVFDERASAVSILYTGDNQVYAQECGNELLALDKSLQIKMDPEDGRNYFKILITEKYSKLEFWK